MQFIPASGPARFLAAVGLGLCLAAPSAHAAFGAGTANTYFTLAPGTNRIDERVQFSDGGADFTFSETRSTDTRGEARMLVDVTGESPLLRALGRSNAADRQAIGGGRGLTGVTFSGPDDTLFTWEVTLTGDLTPPADADASGGDTVARLSAIARLLDDDATFASLTPEPDPSGDGFPVYPDQITSGGVFLDSAGTPGPVEESFTLSTRVDDGDVLHLGLVLTASARGDGAVADGFSTLSGVATVAAGTLTSLPVPEPGTLALLTPAVLLASSRHRRSPDAAGR